MAPKPTKIEGFDCFPIDERTMSYEVEMLPMLRASLIRKKPSRSKKKKLRGTGESDAHFSILQRVERNLASRESSLVTKIAPSGVKEFVLKLRFFYLCFSY